MPLKYDRISASTEARKSISLSRSRATSAANSEMKQKLYESMPRNTEVIVLESEPPLELVKKSCAKIGKTSKIFQRDEQIKLAAEAVMKSKDPSYRARYAKHEYYQKQRDQILPHIEVLEVEGNVLLGIPATSTAQQFATFVHSGRRKQIVIATHDPTHKPARRVPGALRQTETEATIMKSGVVSLLNVGYISCDLTRPPSDSILQSVIFALENTSSLFSKHDHILAISTVFSQADQREFLMYDMRSALHILSSLVTPLALHRTAANSHSDSALRAPLKRRRAHAIAAISAAHAGGAGPAPVAAAGGHRGHPDRAQPLQQPPAELGHVRRRRRRRAIGPRAVTMYYSKSCDPLSFTHAHTLNLALSLFLSLIPCRSFSLSPSPPVSPPRARLRCCGFHRRRPRTVWPRTAGPSSAPNSAVKAAARPSKHAQHPSLHRIRTSKHPFLHCTRANQAARLPCVG